MAIRRITFRLYPTRQIEQKLYYHRRLHKDLYNAAVYNRFTQYQKFGHSVDYFEQQNCLPEFKEVWVEYKEVGSHALQATLKRVDYAFQRWFKGLNKKPRYKSIHNYSGWTYPDKQSWKCHSTGDNGYLGLDKIGSIQMRGQALLWGTPTTCTIVYRKRKKQKAGLNKSILDVGFGMLRQAIQYKITEAEGVFIEVPTKQVKPSQTCPKCGHQHPKTLDERTHHCSKCNYIQDRDIAAAEVMLLWAQGKLPGLGTNLVDVDLSSSTSKTKERKQCGSMKQLGEMKRQKSATMGRGAETRPSTK